MRHVLPASHRRCWEKRRACCCCGLFLNPTCGTARQDGIRVSSLVALMMNTAAAPPFLSEPVIMTLLLSDGKLTAFLFHFVLLVTADPALVLLSAQTRLLWEDICSFTGSELSSPDGDVSEVTAWT